MLQIQYYSNKLKPSQIHHILSNYNIKYSSLKKEIDNKVNNWIQLFWKDICAFLENVEEISKERDKLRDLDRTKQELTELKSQLHEKSSNENKWKNEINNLNKEIINWKELINSSFRRENSLNTNLNLSCKTEEVNGRHWRNKTNIHENGFDLNENPMSYNWTNSYEMNQKNLKSHGWKNIDEAKTSYASMHKTPKSNKVDKITSWTFKKKHRKWNSIDHKIDSDLISKFSTTEINLNKSIEIKPRNDLSYIFKTSTIKNSGLETPIHPPIVSKKKSFDVMKFINTTNLSNTTIATESKYSKSNNNIHISNTNNNNNNNSTPNINIPNTNTTNNDHQIPSTWSMKEALNIIEENENIFDDQIWYWEKEEQCIQELLNNM